MSHKHLCTNCDAIIAEGDFNCEGEGDHDFALCDGCAAVDIAAVEYYDLLPNGEARAAHRAGAEIMVNPATRAEWDRIDAGIKAHCLS